MNRFLAVVKFTTTEILSFWYYEDFKIFRHKEINQKCCKDIINTDLPHATYCYIKPCKTATIGWESPKRLRNCFCTLIFEQLFIGKI